MTQLILNRRKVLVGLAGAVATPYLNIRSAAAQGSGEVVVTDGGGAWGKAQKAAYFDPFEAETGIRVVAAASIPNGAYRASITAGAPASDVTDLSGADLGGFIKEGLLQSIDYDLFAKEDRDSISPVPAHEKYFPSLFYSLVMGFDTQAYGDEKPQTWADMWNIEKFPGMRTVYNASEGPATGAVFETALMADGVAPADLYPLDIKRAFAALDKIKPNILRYWAAGAEPAQLLVDGAVSIASAWNGRISALKSQGQPVDLSWQQAVLQWDGWAVPVGAKNTENAMKFLAYVAKPEAQARFSEAIEYGPTNARTFELLSKERAALLPGNPETVKTQVVQNYEWWNQDSGNGKSNLQLVNEQWQTWIAK